MLKLPYQQPFNTALGCTVFMFLLVLFVAGGDDVIAVSTGRSVIAIRTILRILVFVVPAITGVVVYAICVWVQGRKTTSSSAETQTSLPEDVSRR